MDPESEKQKVRDLIAQSEQVAILMPARPTIDCVAAAEVVARALQANNTHAGFLPSVAPDAAEAPEAFVRVRNPHALTREFIIAIDTTHTPVGQLRYEKHDDRIEIILSPKSESLREDALSFREGKVQCDCVIAIGVPDVEALSPAALGLTPQFFTEVPIITIGNAEDQKSYGEINFISPAQASLSELTYEFLKAAGIGALDTEAATLLLAGIVHETRNFRSPVRVGTHLIAAELLQIGADHAKATVLAEGQRPFALLQLIARASVRSKEGEGGKILWSFLTAEDFEKTTRPTRDISAVLEALPRFFAPHPAEVLLWQDPATREIRGVVRAEHAVLAALAEHEQGELQNQIFVIGATFLNFLEAEQRIAALLGEVLSDKI